MAESDDLLQPNIDRPIRPGEMYLSPEGFKYPNPQLLRRKAKVKAASVLPELQQNFQYALDVMPMSRAGFGQGTQIVLDPELSVLESTITPWFGKVDSPQYMDEVRRVRDSYNKATAALTGTKMRHAREFERQVSALGHSLKRFETQGLGTTIRMGLASPNVATSELDVRNAHMLLSYMMGRNLPPESATMDMMTTKGARATQRHGVRLGLERLNEASPYPFGGSLSEHVRGLELGFGTQGKGNILAGLGLQQERDMPDVVFQEQVLGTKGPLNPFSQKLISMAMKDKERVSQSAAQLAKAVSTSPKFNEASVAYRGALEDFLDEIFNGPMGGGQTQGLAIPGYDVPRHAIKATVDKAFADSFSQNMEPFGKQHLQAAKRKIRDTILEKIPSDTKTPRGQYIVDRVRDIDRGLEGYLKAWIRQQTTFKTPRTESKATQALAGGKKAVVNPATKEVSEAIPARALNVKRIEQGTEQVMKLLGRNAPKIPMLLVTALAAGMVVSGLSRGAGDGEA